MIRLLLSKLPVNIITGLIALFCCLSTGARGQCCPVDTLKINTGYVPMTGIVLAPLATDPKWIITYIDTNLRADIAPMLLTPACSTGGTGAAFVTGPFTVFYSSVASEWINCFDSFYYWNTHDSETWTASRKFSLCDTACVHLRLGVACDNHLLWMSVSNTPGDPSAPRHLFHVGYDVLYPVNFDTCLAAGDHYVNFGIVEDGYHANYTGLDVEGYIATASKVIRPENCIAGDYVCTKPEITSTDSVYCNGGSFTLTSNVTGFSWSSSNTSVATISASGTLTTLAVGSTLITLTDSCGRTDTLTISVVGVTGVIVGTTTLCTGDSATLTCTPSGGTWSSTAPSTASIGAGTGTVYGVSGGTATISYTVSGCSSMTTVTVNPTPAPITGLTSVCSGSSTTLSCATPGGTWSSSLPSVASVVSGTGFVRGISAGIATISYTLTGTGCYSILTFRVDSTPAISGPTYICKNGTGTFTSTVSGTWSSSNTAIATINSSTGVVYGTYSGTGSATVTITCTSAAGCAGTAIVTVYQIPNLAVTPTTATVYCGTAISMTSSIAFTPSSTSYSYVFSPTTGVFPSSGTITSGTGYPFTASVTPPASTTYLITVTDGHGCVASTTRRVVVPCGDFCAMAGGSAVTLLNSASGNIPISSYGSGGAPTYYYVDNPNISGSPFTSNFTGGGTSASFIGAVVAVAPNVAINIPAGKDVYISSSHFFCCAPDTTWLGFRLASTPTDTNGRIKFTQNSLIEDAEIAVASSNASISTAYTATSNPIISANGVIFNRNKIGIQIQNYTPATSGYPFVVDNSIFTSRDMTGYYNTSTTLVYPSAWPTLTELRDYYNPGTIVRPPLNINSPTAKPTTGGATSYARIGCKSTGAAIDARLGIYLVNVGTTTGGTYYGFEMQSDGTPPTVSVPGSFNLFDNLNFGITASKANLVIKGAWFTHLKPKTTVSTEGIGVNATGATSTTDLRLQVNPSGNGSPAMDKNYFYNCKTAIKSIEYNKVNCSYNNVYSDHLVSAPDSTIGHMGYDILATPLATSSSINLAVILKGNYMVNVNTGIQYICDNDGKIGNVNINYNQIVGQVTGFTGGYTKQAIYAQVNNPFPGIPSLSNYLAIRNNLIYKVYNGIDVTGFKRRTVKTDTNTIELTPNLLSTAASQFGIRHTNCDSSRAYNNYVLGSGTGSTITQRAMAGSGNNNTYMFCNSVDNTLTGFEFIGTSNITRWRYNKMDRHKYGLFLQGMFGPQGDPFTPSDNVWGTSCSLGAGLYHTFFNSAVGLGFSKLYVRDNTSTLITDPWGNGGSGVPMYGGSYSSISCPTGGWYDTTLIRVVAPPTYVACNPTYTGFPTGSLYARLAGDSETDTVTTGNGSSEGRSSMGSVNIAAGRKWIDQMAVWQAMLSDTTMADSFAILQALRTMGQQSRYAWLTDIANHIANTDYESASSLLSYNIDSLTNTSTDASSGLTMADGTAANYVVQNYLDVYRYSLKYAAGTLTAADSADIYALAMLCPDNDGKIVFTARGLYYNLTGEVLAPNDACTTGGTYTRSGQQNTQPIKDVNTLAKNSQSYSLHPNPNNGNLTIEQKTMDNSAVKVKVLDAVGKVVYSNNTTFTNGKLDIHLQNSAPGLYLLQLTDNAGNSFVRKFVIQ